MSTYTPIASQTLSAAASSVTFSSIPQGYTDLVLVTSTKTTSASADGAIVCTVNGDTGSNYSATALYGTGSSALSFRSTAQVKMYFGRWSNSQYTTSKTQFNNYSNSTTYKTVLSQGGNTTNYIFEWVNLWRSASAITSMELRVDDTSNFDAGSTFTLYGIQVGQAAQKAQGGNIVTSDGTYVYHTFTSSGAFIPSQALTVDYLIVGGGGASGGGRGGGGGGGGYRTSIGGSPSSLTAKSYPVIIGAGGAGGFADNAGNNGIPSSFNSIEAAGGGRGGTAGANGVAGGSGGGGGGASTTTGNGAAGNTPSASPSQGNAGGNGIAYNDFPTGSAGAGGGGGGAGATGSNASGTNAGNGGNGASNSISGTSVTYAGGGGGGGGNTTNSTGGTGGGGAGAKGSPSTQVAGTNGTANTGGGAGGSSNWSSTAVQAANGGSGIVIIRYAV